MNNYSSFINDKIITVEKKKSFLQEGRGNNKYDNKTKNHF